MLTETFCERLERELLPDVSIVEIDTPWNENQVHNRIPSVLVLVRGNRVFPRHVDMISLLNGKKTDRLTLKSFGQSLDIEWYIKEWDYLPERVDLFTYIRETALREHNKNMAAYQANSLPPIKSLTYQFAKELLQDKEGGYTSLLLGELGQEAKKLCQLERSKLGDFSIVDTSPLHPKGNDRLNTFAKLERLICFYESEIWVHR
jgi:hypothetical protein